MNDQTTKHAVYCIVCGRECPPKRAYTCTVECSQENRRLRDRRRERAHRQRNAAYRARRRKRLSQRVEEKRKQATRERRVLREAARAAEKLRRKAEIEQRRQARAEISAKKREAVVKRRQFDAQCRQEMKRMGVKIDVSAMIA